MRAITTNQHYTNMPYRSLPVASSNKELSHVQACELAYPHYACLTQMPDPLFMTQLQQNYDYNNSPLETAVRTRHLETNRLRLLRRGIACSTADFLDTSTGFSLCANQLQVRLHPEHGISSDPQGIPLKVDECLITCQSWIHHIIRFLQSPPEHSKCGVCKHQAS